MRKLTAALTALAILTFGGCSDNSVEVAEQIAETEISETTSAETAATKEKITTSETEEITETETQTEVTDSEKKVTSQAIKITPANEVYDVYPIRIRYPEKQPSDITAEKAEVQESFEKDGVVVNIFSAAYPVFSGGDALVTEKINGYIKNYVDRIYGELKKAAENYVFDERFDVDGFPYNMCGFIYERKITAGDYSEYSDNWQYDVNGNILSVYFEDHEYGAGAMHGYETPVAFTFDLRTGENVDIDGIIADRDGFGTVMSNALKLYLSQKSEYENFEDIFLNGNDDWIKTGEELLEMVKSRMTFKNGCVGYYLEPYEYGSYAEWIRLIEVPAKDIFPYLNDYGKGLFDGFMAAESMPARIIEYEGEKYFDTSQIIRLSSSNFDESADYGSDEPEYSEPLIIRDISDDDREFMSLFPDAYILELNGCRIGSFEKIAEMKNIEMLGLKYCDFDGISALLGSNINYIYGAGHNIPYEQAREFMAQGEEHSHYIAGSVINDEYGISSWLGY